jgi:hypothetical protein
MVNIVVGIGAEKVTVDLEDVKNYFNVSMPTNEQVIQHAADLLEVEYDIRRVASNLGTLNPDATVTEGTTVMMIAPPKSDGGIQ